MSSLPASRLDTPQSENYSRNARTPLLARIIYTHFMPDNYFARYLPLLVHLLMAMGIAGGMVGLSALFSGRRPSRVKSEPYECGMTGIGDASGRFSVKFYLVGMLFILFDVEVVFLYPWAVIFHIYKKPERTTKRNTSIS